MNILVVDDEPLARERLTDLVDECDHRVIASAANGREALRKCERMDVDVVLLDIEMPGMSGLEAAHALRLLENPPAVVFCTAYDAHALAAFDAAAVDYLLKPVRRERLGEALQRAAQVRGIEQSLPAAGQRSHLCARMQGALELVSVDDVICLVAEDKYVVVVHPGGELLIEDSLITLESEFPSHFVRVHRGALVTPSRIEALARSASGQPVLRMVGTDREVDVSRRNLARVRKMIKSL